MGVLDRLLGREKFSQWSIADKAAAAWWFGTDLQGNKAVTPYTVLGLSAVVRALQILCVAAGLPLHTYERQDDAKERMPSDFDDPYPGVDGMTPFAWMETLIIHLALWRKAFLWHETRADGSAGVAYRPVNPDVFSKVWRNAEGKMQFEYTDANNEKKVVGSETLTFIAGPSIDGADGHPLLKAAKAVFSAAMAGDAGAERTLGHGIRIGGIVAPETKEDEFDEEEGKAIEESLKAKITGPNNAGGLAVFNRALKLQKWQPNNDESQWLETKQAVLGDIERLFGVPPHLMADTEKQTSWGTGVAEQNLGLARYTLRGWTDRIEQVLSRKLARGPIEQFCEFDYAGLLQGTPEQEIELLLKQVDGGLLTIDEARKIRNLPPLTPAQKAEMKPPTPPASPQPMPPQMPTPIRKGAAAA